MNRHDIALTAAGLLGGVGALVHGALLDRYLVRPLWVLAADDGRMSSALRRLTPPLLQFSTFNWLLGGAALVVAGACLGREARVATGLLVGSSYLFGATANLWATRGHHPGWVVLGAAVALIAFGLAEPRSPRDVTAQASSLAPTPE